MSVVGVGPYTVTSINFIYGDVNVDMIVSGSAPRNAVVPGDVYIFAADFTPDDFADPTTPYDISMGAFQDSNFVTGIDTSDFNNQALDITFTGPDQVQPSSATIYTADLVPEPVALGWLALGVPLLARRRKAE